MANKINVLTNIPFIVQFKYDSPKIWDNVGQDGKAYKTYSYAVIHQGVDTYLSADWKLQPLLEQMGALRDRELQLLKYQDGKYTNWKIMDVRGNDITPTTSPQRTQAPTRPVSPQGAHTSTPDQIQALEKRIAGGFAKRDARIDELEKQVGYMVLLFKQNNPDAYELHKDQLPEPKEPEIPIIENVEEFEKKTSDILGIK